LPLFFAKAVELFGLSKSSTVLDLGCGPGALSLGFAPYCQSVLAVDKSQDMLSQRPEAPDNVRFLLADLNAETSLPARADLVVIGNAVHFFDREKLIPLLDGITAPAAPVFVCGTTISPRTPWCAPYKRLRKRYSTLRVPLDVEGRACFSGSPWLRGRSLRVVARRQFSARDLLLTYPSSLEAILRNKEEFERELENVLAPHYRTPNRAVGDILNWGIEYRRA
jgi:SAM-dependent methyltransferase